MRKSLLPVVGEKKLPCPSQDVYLSVLSFLVTKVAASRYARKTGSEHRTQIQCGDRYMEISQ
jgi:hypothetical protein